MLGIFSLKIFAEQTSQSEPNAFDFFITVPKSPNHEALWYKNHKNPRDQKSPTEYLSSESPASLAGADPLLLNYKYSTKRVGKEETIQAHYTW